MRCLLFGLGLGMDAKMLQGRVGRGKQEGLVVKGGQSVMIA